MYRAWGQGLEREDQGRRCLGKNGLGKGLPGMVTIVALKTGWHAHALWYLQQQASRAAILSINVHCNVTPMSSVQGD